MPNLFDMIFTSIGTEPIAVLDGRRLSEQG